MTRNSASDGCWRRAHCSGWRSCYGCNTPLPCWSPRYGNTGWPVPLEMAVARRTGSPLPLGGVLDALTWGTPFQSLWLNVVRNSLQGVGSSWSTQPWNYYAQFELRLGGMRFSSVFSRFSAPVGRPPSP